VGKFAAAHQGTLLLDEIGEMSPALQAKLLHVLQDQTFTRLGSNEPTTVDVRIIAATNRDLGAMIRDGGFREDLYYRLQVIEIRIPPLRERREEIVPLSEFFLRRDAKRYRRNAGSLSARIQQALLEYPWPGNIRELENIIKRLVILQDEPSVLARLRRPDDQHAASTRHEERETPGERLKDVAQAAARDAEIAAITRALERCRWNRKQAARLLDVGYKTLLNRIKQYDIEPPEPAAARHET
jgi:two-component system response regulator AtoC